MIRKILTALAALSLSAAVGGALAAPALAITVPVVSQDVDVAYSSAFSARCSDYSGGAFPVRRGHRRIERRLHLRRIASGTSPSHVLLADGTEVIAFHGSDGNLWTLRGSPGGSLPSLVDQDVPMMAGTSPSITVDGANNAVAFQGSNGDLWTWLGSGGSRTPLSTRNCR